jgi:hypothetical protein
MAVAVLDETVRVCPDPVPPVSVIVPPVHWFVVNALLVSVIVVAAPAVAVPELVAGFSVRAESTPDEFRLNASVVYDVESILYRVPLEEEPMRYCDAGTPVPE